MTTPTHPSLVTASAEVAAERFGMPVIDARRSQLIAALHSLINWIIDHPDVPAATHVVLSHHPVFGNTTVTTEDLVRLAADLDGHIDGGATSKWMETQLCTTAEHGANIKLAVFAGDVRARQRPL